MNDTHSSIFPDRPINYAGFWERFFAALVDGIVMSAIGYGLNYLFTGNIFGLWYWNFFSNIVLGWLYYALQESGSRQATLGKMALDIKVCNLEGGRISFAQATGRFFGRYLSAMILLIGYLMMLWDSKKQTLHDKLARTLVVKEGRQF